MKKNTICKFLYIILCLLVCFELIINILTSRFTAANSLASLEWPVIIIAFAILIILTVIDPTYLKKADKTTYQEDKFLAFSRSSIKLLVIVLFISAVFAIKHVLI